MAAVAAHVALAQAAQALPCLMRRALSSVRRRDACGRRLYGTSEFCRVPYEVVPCCRDDEDRAMAFLERTFYCTEPVLVAAGLAGRPPPQLLDHSRQALREGLSLIAVNPDNRNQVYGILVNGIVRREDSCVLRAEAEATSCEAARRVLLLWAWLLEQPAQWELDGPGHSRLCYMMELKELATDSCVRGSGVGLQLMKDGLEVARRCGAPAVRVDCTSHYSAQICEKLGMTKVVQLKYSEYVDADGRPMFPMQHPHDKAVVYVQTMSCSQAANGAKPTY